MLVTQLCRHVRACGRAGVGCKVAWYEAPLARLSGRIWICCATCLCLSWLLGGFSAACATSVNADEARNLVDSMAWGDMRLGLRLAPDMILRTGESNPSGWPFDEGGHTCCVSDRLLIIPPKKSDRCVEILQL